MGYIQGAERNQIVFLPNALDDYVGENNEVRAIDAFIDSLDMGAMGFKAEPAREGRPGYDPRDMLKLYMYGYLNHIRSSRRLQKEAGRNVEVMWLLKTVIPDFRCIADFRKDNAKAIKEVFKAFVKLCDRAGLLSHESVVIDGSKFKAANADHKSYLSSSVPKMIENTDGRIEHYMKELDEYDKRKAKEALIKSTCADLRQKFSLARKKSAGIIGLFQTFLTLSSGNLWREDAYGDLISASLKLGN